MFPLYDSVPSRTTPVVTFGIIGACFLVFFYELQLGAQQLQEFFYVFGFVPARYSDARWAERVGFSAHNYWPFVTSMFLHAGWLHILGNMWVFWIFGDNVEDRLGPGRFLAFYLLCGIAASVVHWLTNQTSTVPALGASGAISGVMGAYLVLYPKSRIVLMIPVLFIPFFFDVPAVFFLVFWYLIQLVSGWVSLGSSGSASGVAFWAHVGGFVAGIALLPLFLIGRGKLRFHRDHYHMKAAWHRPSRRDHRI